MNIEKQLFIKFYARRVERMEAQHEKQGLEPHSSLYELCKIGAALQVDRMKLKHKYN